MFNVQAMRQSAIVKSNNFTRIHASKRVAPNWGRPQWAHHQPKALEQRHSSPSKTEQIAQTLKQAQPASLVLHSIYLSRSPFAGPSTNTPKKAAETDKNRMFGQVTSKLLHQGTCEVIPNKPAGKGPCGKESANVLPPF
jgi:hypothetical protein